MPHWHVDSYIAMSDNTLLFYEIDKDPTPTGHLGDGLVEVKEPRVKKKNQYTHHSQMQLYLLSFDTEHEVTGYTRADVAHFDFQHPDEALLLFLTAATNSEGIREDAELTLKRYIDTVEPETTAVSGGTEPDATKLALDRLETHLRALSDGVIVLNTNHINLSTRLKVLEKQAPKKAKKK